MDRRQPYNLYLSRRLHDELQRLISSGLPTSAIARLAVKKWTADGLPSGDDEACPIRVNTYLSAPDAERLEQLASRNGTSRAEALRRLITAYLDTNRDAINALF